MHKCVTDLKWEVWCIICIRVYKDIHTVQVCIDETKAKEFNYYNSSYAYHFLLLLLRFPLFVVVAVAAEMGALLLTAESVRVSPCTFSATAATLGQVFVRVSPAISFGAGGVSDTGEEDMDMGALFSFSTGVFFFGVSFASIVFDLGVDSFIFATPLTGADLGVPLAASFGFAAPLAAGGVVGEVVVEVFATPLAGGGVVVVVVVGLATPLAADGGVVEGFGAT